MAEDESNDRTGDEDKVVTFAPRPDADTPTLAGAAQTFSGYRAFARDGELGAVVEVFEEDAGGLVIQLEDGRRLVPGGSIARVDHGEGTLELRADRDQVTSLPRYDAGDEDRQQRRELLAEAAVNLG